MKHLLLLPVWLYRALVSPWKPPCCRFRPTCSEYALQALRAHGALRGLWLIGWRLLRCQPFCEPGFDPVPGTGDAHGPPEADQRRGSS
jgi:hypothetical protein